MECCGEERGSGQARYCLAIGLLRGICRRVWGGPEDPGCPDTAVGSWRRSSSGIEAAQGPVVHTERQKMSVKQSIQRDTCLDTFLSNPLIETSKTVQVYLNARDM